MPIGNVAYAPNPMQQSKPASGIHQSAASTYNRLCELNRGVSTLLDRVRGGVPEQSGQANAPVSGNPSLLTHLGNVDTELCHLEKQITELAEQIG